MARPMRAHLLLTALLLSAHLFSSEARLAQARRHGDARVEAGQADAVPDTWDRRLLQDAPPGPPASDGGKITGIIIGSGLAIYLVVGSVIAYWRGSRGGRSKKKRRSQARAQERAVDVGLASVALDARLQLLGPEEEALRAELAEAHDFYVIARLNMGFPLDPFLWGPAGKEAMVNEALLRRRADVAGIDVAFDKPLIGEVGRQIGALAEEAVLARSPAKRTLGDDPEEALFSHLSIIDPGDGGAAAGPLRLNQPFGSSEPDARATGQAFDETLMEDYQAELASPERVLLEHSIREVTTRVTRLNKELYDLLAKGRDKFEEARAAERRGDKRAEFEADREHYLLTAEYATKKKDRDELSKELAKKREQREEGGRG